MKLFALIIPFCWFSSAMAQLNEKDMGNDHAAGYVDTARPLPQHAGSNYRDLLHSSLLSAELVNDLYDTIPAVSYDTFPPVDLLHNRYGDLLNDDPAYNPKAKWYVPASRVLLSNVFNWAVARYVYKFDWAKVTPADWKNNFQKGPEFDMDGFGLNFIGHPHTGNYYFNIARANGYSFWGSLPFAIQGSLTWEYLGENTRPSWNDIINTPLSGMFLGEIFYRISSNILDDRITGKKRFWRELLAGIVNPPRGLNRLTQGRTRRVTTTEVYQQEPLNFIISAGAHRINNDEVFGTGGTQPILNFQLDYGDPFEIRKRKPFDVFRLRIEMSYGNTRKLLENVNGYGILAGRTVRKDRLLLGLFQHFDYWNNNAFEVGTLGYGGGLISRVPVSKRSNLFSTFHLAAVPLAGNNTQAGPDTSSVRTYNFGGGLQAKIEESLVLNKWATIGFTGFYYWISTYKGIKGNSLVGLFKPYVTLKLYRNLSIGFEHHVYNNSRNLVDQPHFKVTRTEQKLFIQLFLEDRQRNDRYR